MKRSPILKEAIAIPIESGFDSGTEGGTDPLDLKARRDADDVARDDVPSRSSLPTRYHPCHNLMMVIPLPTIKSVGQIILPDRAQITMNEGHIVEKGPLCSEHFNVGDCITWDANSEYRMKIDGSPFVLVKENCVIMRIPGTELGVINTNSDPDPVAGCYR